MSLRTLSVSSDTLKCHFNASERTRGTHQSVPLSTGPVVSDTWKCHKHAKCLCGHSTVSVQPSKVSFQTLWSFNRQWGFLKYPSVSDVVPFTQKWHLGHAIQSHNQLDVKFQTLSSATDTPSVISHTQKCHFRHSQVSQTLPLSLYTPTPTPTPTSHT